MTPHYSKDFYDEIADGSLRSASRVLPLVLEFVAARSVVDVGCGTGTWLSQFERLGVNDFLGVDGSWVKQDQLRIPAERFRMADLTKPLGLGRTFDLAISLEVAEHLPHHASETFIESLTRAAPVVVFSAAVPYQAGNQHVNERWPSYWAQLFARHGFRALDVLRPKIWHDPDIEWWYAQNAFFAVDSHRLHEWPLLAEAARWAPPLPLDVVHPRLFLQSAAASKPPKELFHGALGAFRDKWLISSRRKAGRLRAQLARWPTSSR